MESDQSHPNTLPLRPFQEIADSVPASVQMRLGELFPLLIDALQNDRTWLSDFADERIHVSADLSDVVQAYASFRKSA